MTTRIGITGAAGRMGRTLVEAIGQADGLALTAAIERPESTLVGADSGELSGQGKNGVAVVSSLVDVIHNIDVLIDFKRQVDNNPIKNNWNERGSLEGEIIWLNLNGGNGRLKCDEHSNLFFYLNESENSEVLNVGDRVNFSMGKNSKGPKAEKVMKINNT